MKKVIFLSVLMFVSFLGFSQETEAVKEEIHLNWVDSYKDALKKARKEKKPLLIYFTGSDWCGPCIRLDKKLFHTQKFKDFSDENMVLYMADFPRNRDLVSKEARKYNKKLKEQHVVDSFPAIIVVDGKENVLGEKRGSYMVEYYFPFFESLIK